MPRLWGLFLLLLLLPQTSNAAPGGLPRCNGQGAPQQCMCEIESLKPTQVSIGWLHVQDILKDRPSKLQDRAATKPTQVVIGPDNKLYVTDGHHHARAMLEQLRQGIGPAKTICRIVEDHSTVAAPNREAFLTWLAGRHEARLNGGDDVDGMIRPGLYPPEDLSRMTNDSYRSLASFVEDGCNFKMDGDFGEFPLADLLRQAQVHAPVALDHKKDQGRRAAGELIANLDRAGLKPTFQRLPHHQDIQNCAVPNHS